MKEAYKLVSSDSVDLYFFLLLVFSFYFEVSTCPNKSLPLISFEQVSDHILPPYPPPYPPPPSLLIKHSRVIQLFCCRKVVNQVIMKVLQIKQRRFDFSAKL